MQYQTVDAVITPEGSLEALSRAEVARLLDTGKGAYKKGVRAHLTLP